MRKYQIIAFSDTYVKKFIKIEKEVPDYRLIWYFLFADYADLRLTR